MVTQEEVILLARGDLFFQFTDGLVEAPNREKKEFGDDRLRDLLLKHASYPAGDLIDLIEESVQSHVGAAEQEDDITMIAFRVL
jgi:serine phosphatase RsbU (regulator of sigma subunit)